MKSKKRIKTKKVQQAAAQITEMPDGYKKFLSNMKSKISHSCIKAALAVNRELILLYWEIGHNIYKQQKKEGWGAKIIDRLANDLSREFPSIKGFSVRNLKYMRLLAFPQNK